MDTIAVSTFEIRDGASCRNKMPNNPVNYLVLFNLICFHYALYYSNFISDFTYRNSSLHLLFFHRHTLAYWRPDNRHPICILWKNDVILHLSQNTEYKAKRVIICHYTIVIKYFISLPLTMRHHFSAYGGKKACQYK